MDAARTDDDPNEQLTDALAKAQVAATALRQRAPGGDWVDAFCDGDAVATDIAAFVAGCSTSTIRRLCVETAKAGHPIGVLIAGSNWLVSLRRLLAQIEQSDGRPAYLAAQTRANKIADLKLRDQTSIRFDRVASSEPSPSEPKSIASI
jgi:hypothetical protein